MLDYEKIQNGMFKLVRKPFDPNLVFERLWLAVLHQTRGRNIKIYYKVDSEKPQIIKISKNNKNRKQLPSSLIGDKKRLYQVLNNLLQNAIKFSNSDEICIRASYNEATQLLCISVQDSGTGILLEDLPKVFNFLGSDEKDGTGLTIVKEIVEASGG